MSYQEQAESEIWDAIASQPPADEELANVRAQLARFERLAAFNPAGTAGTIARLRARAEELERR